MPKQSSLSSIQKSPDQRLYRSRRYEKQFKKMKEGKKKGKRERERERRKERNYYILLKRSRIKVLVPQKLTKS